MEGLYYESAATTPYHFMAVAPLSGPGNASNPVRGLDYRSIDDFDLGVRYLRLLGVRYYMAYSTEAKDDGGREPGPAARRRRCPTATSVPPSGWNIYEVRDHADGRAAALRAGRRRRRTAGTQSECFGRRPVAGQKDPELGAWECLAAGWWNDPAALDRPLAAGGPASWARVAAGAGRRPRPGAACPTVKVTDVHETDDSVSFHVLAHRRARGGADLLLPELGGGRARTVRGG